MLKAGNAPDGWKIKRGGTNSSNESGPTKANVHFGRSGLPPYGQTAIVVFLL